MTKVKNFVVRPFQQHDIARVAAIHAESFVRQAQSVDWIGANARAYPRCRYFVIESQNDIVGYILWTEKSGFRQEVVLELEQMAITPTIRRQGAGHWLIQESLRLVQVSLSDRGATLKSVLVTTRTDNAAQALYASALGARQEAVIKNLFSADEAIMIAISPAHHIAQNGAGPLTPDRA